MKRFAFALVLGSFVALGGCAEQEEPELETEFGEEETFQDETVQPMPAPMPADTMLRDTGMMGDTIPR